MTDEAFDIGMVGLGVMGRNLSINIAEKGFSIVGYDTDVEKVRSFRDDAAGARLQGAESLQDFIRQLRKPRAVMMLVPAGNPVDAVIRSVLPYLEKGDILIDGGNSFFHDTELRQKSLTEKGIYFIGVGISGGESGARYGPSMMPGGPIDAYQRVKPIFEAVAAHVNGEPCVAYLGPGSAGHYVKMVHNGIEYALMQLIAECYDLMRRGLRMNNDEIGAVFSEWNNTELSSFLIEITANIFRKVDETTGKRLVDEILDEAKQKGTGQWTSQEALDLRVPAPTIDVAVSMRDLSAFKSDREAGSLVLTGPQPSSALDREQTLQQLQKALYAGMVIVFAQGMALLSTASASYKYGYALDTIAKIWRSGCIIRAALLDRIWMAYQDNPQIANLMFDPYLSAEVLNKYLPDLREVASIGVRLGLPVPGLMASLAYYDSYRSAWLPANLIQAQRDYFGAHTYERLDEKGVFHTEWA